MLLVALEAPGWPIRIELASKLVEGRPDMVGKFRMLLND